MTTDNDWIFDHMNLYMAGDAPILKFSTDVLDWRPGPCLTLPSPGTWLHQNDDTLVHPVMQDDNTPELVFSYTAFRIRKDAADVLAAVRESSMPHRVRKHPARPAAQIFVQLPGGVVLELEVPMSGSLKTARGYQQNRGIRPRPATCTSSPVRPLGGRTRRPLPPVPATSHRPPCVS